MNGTQLTFQAHETDASSQTRRVIARLKATPGEDVPMFELAMAATENKKGIGFCVSRRIYDARRIGKTEGFFIPKPRCEWKGGQLHTWYRIEYFQQP